jgi:hypothetical protein
MTSRRRSTLALTHALALLLVMSLTACGSDGGTTATDTSPTGPSPTDRTTHTAEPSPTAPTVEPKPGSLPDFPYQDYAYTLEMRCFCANFDQKYRITVAGGEVSEVTWATDGVGHEIGDPVADEYLHVTIQDIIDQGNDPEAAQVDVAWPPGQAWPDSVYVDKDKTVADEEVTWMISEVSAA